MREPSAISAQLRIFGFARLPGVAKNHVTALERAFAELMESPDGGVPMERITRFDVTDAVPDLVELAEAEPLRSVREAYFGRDSHVISSDANVLVGDSYWHSDGFYETPFLRFVLYLEPLGSESGALRFLPGSHRIDNGWVGEPTRDVIKHEANLGRPGADVPAEAVDSEPGDVIVFDTSVLHSAWKGTLRRQFGFNAAAEPVTDTERADTKRYFLNRYVSGSVRLG